MRFMPALAISSPEAIVNTLLLEVTSPATVPVPFQFPPVAASVPLIVPPERLMSPLPVTVALPPIRPAPASVAAVPTATLLAEASELLTVSVPPLMAVGPV